MPARRVVRLTLAALGTALVPRLAPAEHRRRKRPVALICASGGRSSRLAKALTENGFSHVLDVSEGMLGSFAGLGWIARGLPFATG